MKTNNHRKVHFTQTKLRMGDLPYGRCALPTTARDALAHLAIAAMAANENFSDRTKLRSPRPTRRSDLH